MKKKLAFPNQYFNSQNSYFDFIDQHPGYYGTSAYKLKKELDKEKDIGYPKVSGTHKGIDDDFDISNEYKRKKII